MANGSNTIGLCMIVKDEAELIRRCLASALPLVDYILVVDTGSTDGTQQAVRDFIDEHGVRGQVVEEPWRDFAYNRSFALQRLREVGDIDYALILDADDVLVIEPGFDLNAFKAQMCHDHYDVLVDEGAVTHYRGHICSNRLPYAYRGVLHEYLDAPPGERGHAKATGLSIRASRGGARSRNPRKYHDDAALLESAIATETDPGLASRYTFYLAQSYRDAGRLDDAAKAYAKRAEMGGWEEEAWHSRLAEARCLKDLGDEGGFLRQALAAFNQRPQRAEPLYDLARYHRDRSQHEAAALFAERGLALERATGDTLFVEDFVYQWGLQEEYSIAANYVRDPARKDRGFAACNWLALNRDVPSGTRGLARYNLRFYVEPAAKLLPSFAARPVGFTPPAGWHPMNPSVARRGDEIVMVQRTVNFVLEDGNYRTPDDGPVETRNFLLRLDPALAVTSSVEILPPADLPPPRFGLVLGFEDMRLFAWAGGLWCIATVCELTPEAWRQQVLARIDESGAGPCRLVDWRVLEPKGPRRHEKNWMPLVNQDGLRFVYLCDPTRLVDDMARTVDGSIPPIAAEEFRGGSQAIAFAGGWLALVHEVGFSGADNKERLYHHRFVWFDKTYALRGVSRPFIFERPGIEFAAGLAWHPDGKRLIMSYGVGDGTAWLATVDAGDVRAALLDAARLPSASPAALDDTAGAAERFLGAQSLTTPSAEGVQLPLHAQETVSVESPPEAEHEVSVEPEMPSEQNPAPAVGPASTEQDAPHTDQPPALVLGSFGAEDFESQHRLRPARDLHACVDAYPRVLLAILAKQKERPLPLYLNCIEGLDYPKSAIFLYVRTNNNTDRTEQILREWVERVGPSYAGVEFDAEPVAEPVEQVPPHEWNSTRFRVLGQIRNVSLQKTLEHGCDFYFVCDSDNFIRSCTLKELVALNLPIVAPFLRVTNPTHGYSNFFAKTDAAGFFAGCDEYQWITRRWVRGVVEVPVVHCTYLVRSDVIPELHYLDGSDDWEFAVFCKSAREAGIPQYLDNRQVYGYITFDPESNATKVNVAGGESDQIGFARAELEEVDGRKLSDTLQLPHESPEELKRRFSEIYERQLWGPGSGVGSAPDKTLEYRTFVQQFMARNRVRSVVDLGCGEWQFSQLIDWSGVRYLGVDVVPAMIEKNQRDFGGGNIAFETFESLAKLPRADLLLCKDVLQHLPNSLVKEYLAAFRKQYKFLLITNDEEPVEILNTDTEIGGWRTLRLDREPFGEPGAVVLSWRVPYLSGGTTKATYLLYGESRERIIAPALANDITPDAASRTDAMDMPLPLPRIAGPKAQLIFLHSSWRTSSTWFWAKFRPFPETTCFYEPFNDELATIEREKAAAVDNTSWDSRHPSVDPYRLEYLPMINPTGGVQLFEPSMHLDWFTPIGGLRGELRPAEIQYLRLLIDHGREHGKLPVFGETSSLGRIWAIRNSVGGYHIFVHRNLWLQWLSYLYYRRRGNNYYHETTAHYAARSDDPFIAGLADFYVKRALDFRVHHKDQGDQPLSEEQRLPLLRSLPESHAFAMFMALHIYLYLHAQLAADLTVDVTKLARDSEYRSRIESELSRQTGLEISLSDAIDGQPASGAAIDAAAIDWDEIREHAHSAVQALSAFADPIALMENASAFINSAIGEIHKSEAALAKGSDAAEEIWYGRLQEARCYWELGDDDGFMRRALELCKERPNRAEPLFDLARFHRERGMPEKAADFAEAGLALERPGEDAKFVEHFVYQAGLQEELSIAAFYCSDPARKDRGFAACNWLALSRDIPEGTRNLARGHLRFYVVPASKLMPSFSAQPVGFSPPEGWQATNPSVARCGGEIVMIQRAVNYELENGNYRTLDGAPIATRNFLLRLNSTLDVESEVEILSPPDLPAHVYGLALGFEDARLFAWNGGLWCSSTLRELTPEGWCQQVLARIEQAPDGPCRLANWRVLAPEGPPRHEKNWMPLVEPPEAGDGDERLRFIYLCDPTRVVDDTARVVAETTPPIAAEQFRGGTQAIEFDGGWLALVHEEVPGATFADRVYHHRFVWFHKAGTLQGVSRPFFFEKHDVEFAAGLAWHPDGKRLIVSYGVGDGEAWIATIDADDIRQALDDATRLPSTRNPATDARLRAESEEAESAAENNGQSAAPRVSPAAEARDATHAFRREGFENLDFLHEHDWLCHSDRRIVRLASETSKGANAPSPASSTSVAKCSGLVNAELVFGPVRLHASEGAGPLVFERSRASEQGPERIRIADERGTVHTFSRFQPLLYFCVYGTNSFYECLGLSLMSLAEHGRYSGAIGVACDRSATDLIRYIPEQFQDRLIISEASSECGWFNQYYWNTACITAISRFFIVTWMSYLMPISLTCSATS